MAGLSAGFAQGRQKAFHETARVLRTGGCFMMSEFTVRGVPSAEELAAYQQVWHCMPPVPYTDRRDEIVARYGPELVAQMDSTMPLVRSFVCDHLGYYLFLLREPG